MKDSKLRLLIILNIIFTLTVIFIFYNILNNIEYLTNTTTVVELDNGSKVIEIKSIYNWKIIFLYILIILIDLIIFITYKIIQYFNKTKIKEKYVILIICILNLLFLLLFPGMILSLIIIDILLIIMFLIKLMFKIKKKATQG